MEAARRFRQELWRGGQVELGRQKCAVAEIGRQQRQLGLDIDAVAIPAQQTMDGKGVAQIMYAWAGAPTGAFPTHHAEQIRNAGLHADEAVRPPARAPE